MQHQPEDYIMSTDLLNLALHVTHVGDKRITLAQKSVLNILAWRADKKDDRAWPSVEDLMVACSASRRTIKNALRALEDGGLISRRRRRYRSSIVTFNLPGQENMRLQKVQESALLEDDEAQIPNPESAAGAHSEVQKVHLVPPESAPPAPITTLNDNLNMNDTKKGAVAVLPNRNEEGDYPVNETAWQDLMHHRKELGVKKLTARGERLKRREFAQYPPDIQQAAVDKTISEGWRGVFFDNVAHQHGQQMSAGVRGTATMKAAMRRFIDG